MTLLSTPTTYDEQVRFVTNLLRIVPGISLFGSLGIVRCIYVTNKRNQSEGKEHVNNIRRPTYQRLLLCLCVVDILWSINFILGTIMLPSSSSLDEDSDHPFDIIFDDTYNTAYGNFTTCNIQGFFLFIGGIGTIYLNACLMVYFLLTIRCNVSQQQILTVTCGGEKLK